MRWYEKKKYNKEFIRNWLEPYATKISNETGVTASWSDSGAMADYYSNFLFNYMDKFVGSLGVDFMSDTPKFRYTLMTKVTFITKSTFTKTNLRNEVKINVDCSKDVAEEKIVDWMKLICKQIKTAYAKKAKFEMDTDFE